MATLVLAAAGAAAGGAVGGTVLGLSSAAIGQAVGATLGSAIDQKLLGPGSRAVATGQVDRFRVLGAAEGEAIPQIYGQMRTAGHVIWSSRFLEKKTQGTQGSKSNKTTIVEYSYSVNLAVAVCEGEVSRIGRVWADGNEISLENITWRLHSGSEDQRPDPLIEAIEGPGIVPAYRGTAYVVFENLELGPFGNRIPQLNFEVVRKVTEVGVGQENDPFEQLSAVALIPGTGEYSLATTPVRYEIDKGLSRSANQNNTDGRTDLEVSLDQLKSDLPNVNAVSMVISWFGDDLRCSECTLRPKVEQNDIDGNAMPWTVSGLDRGTAQAVSRVDNGSVFGGTTCDRSVIEAMRKLKSEGMSVMFYPFVLMDIPPANSLRNPYSGQLGQPVFPWRGRITLDKAPGRSDSSDKTADSRTQVRRFFGDAEVSHFSTEGEEIGYTGPDDWGYRRFILHYATLCAVTGGVSTFIIGSELRGLTQLRDEENKFPAVDELIRLAMDVRLILGPDVDISYAADWSEYFGYHPQDGSGDVFFHLDPLWASNDIDFVGIDNYMPLSDWRDSADHLDAAAISIYDLQYLSDNVAGGEGYDWFYPSRAARNEQRREPIFDGAYGEHWIFRYKDLKSWWGEEHHDRPGGVRNSQATPWVPQSKPIVFTEFGCAAIDKGTNQPNVFVDEKSSENFTPYFSNGARDDFIQYRYLQAHFRHWQEPVNNPVSSVTGQPMVDMSRAFAWAYDTRPWPDFPARSEVWSDGENYGRGHWISGRASASTLAAVVRNISARANFTDIDVSRLHGLVRGYAVNQPQTARQALQPLMLSHGFECSEHDGKIVFVSRPGALPINLDLDQLALSEQNEALTFLRTPNAELSSQIQVSYHRPEADYQIGSSMASIPDRFEPTTTRMEIPVALNGAEGADIAARFLSEAFVARDEIQFALPPSMMEVTVGDIIRLDQNANDKLYRIDRLEDAGSRRCRATRVEYGIYQSGGSKDTTVWSRKPSLPPPPYIEFLDLPLITGQEVPHAPYVAATATPWSGDLAVYASSQDSGYTLNAQIAAPSTMGTTIEPLYRTAPDLWSRAASFRVRLPSGSLQSKTVEEVLNGSNIAALRSANSKEWELLQFQRAELVGPFEYEISNLLRGQLGTDAIMPDVHPVGSDFVLIDGSAIQLDLPLSARGLDRHYRIGPALRSYQSTSFQHFVSATDGIGLRPYSPVHVRSMVKESGDIAFSWVRRTRIDGDSWQGHEVPLGEAEELYLVKIVSNGTTVREFTTGSPSYNYSAQAAYADQIVLPFQFEVAQVSSQFGPGPSKRITVNG